MRILFSGYLLPPATGGGNISALTLLKRLAQKHEVTVLGVAFTSSGQKKLVNGIKLYEWRPSYLLRKRFLPHYLRSLLRDITAGRVIDRLSEKLNPDLVIVEPPTMIKLPRGPGAKSLFFVRHFSFRPITCYLSWRRRVYNEPFAIIQSYRNRAILRGADLVLANSKFMADALGQVGIEAKVIYPFIDLSSYKVPEASREFILFINPRYLKGVDIVLQIARRLPNQKFLIVGEITQSLKREIRHYKLENVELLGWCDDMREVYGKARIVLVPSVWEEPFGRIPIEAGINGIPTIASNRGGLPESVGEGGILIKDIWNIEEWVRAIERLNDPKIYKELSQRAIENAKKFDFEKTFRELQEIVNASLGLPEPL